MCDEFYQRRCIQQFYENFFQEAAGGFAEEKKEYRLSVEMSEELQQLLPEEKRDPFEREIMERLIDAYPLRRDNSVLFRFPRLFFTASPKSKQRTD